MPKLDALVASPTTAPSGGVLAVRRPDGEVIAEADRAEIMARLARDEHVEVNVEYVAYSQAPGRSNRNYVRFREDSLASMAKTAIGRPFLRDHAQDSMLAVGGVIESSELRRSGDAQEIVQTARLTEPWAVRAATLGTMNGFSIGWNTIPADGELSAEVGCSICGKPIDGCAVALGHYRGRLVGDRRVEVVIPNADLLETSAVPVPAVPETRPLDVTPLSAAEIAADLRTLGVSVSFPPGGNVQPSENPENRMDPKTLAAVLGIESTEAADILREITRLKTAETESGERLAEAESERDDALGKLAGAERETRLAQARVWADEQVEAGRLAADTPMHAHLVALYADDPETASALAGGLPAKTGAGREMRSGSLAPSKSSALKDDGTPDYEALAERLAVEAPAEMKSLPSKLSPADYVRHNYDELASMYGWPEREVA